MKEFKVGISDYKVTQAPNTLITLGLGSCVGIALYDKRTKIGGLVHIMLADSTGFSDTSNWVKFADLAIPKVAEEITGGRDHPLVAKIAGGASMFQFKSSSPGLEIGKRNIEMVRKTLNDLSIPILGEHVGGKTGRTMIVNLDTFEVSVRLVNRKIHYI